MTTATRPTTPAWKPLTPEQEIEFALLLEACMLEAHRKDIARVWDEGLARHMAGPAEGVDAVGISWEVPE